MVGDAGQLRHQHADVLGAERHLEAHQLLDREHEAVLHAHRRAVIEPVEVGQRLGVGLVLDQLLGAAVEQADVRVDALDDLAVELHDQAQHAVRRRVLRAEVDRVVADRLVAGVARMAELRSALADVADVRPRPCGCAVSVMPRFRRPAPVARGFGSASLACALAALARGLRASFVAWSSAGSPAPVSDGFSVVFGVSAGVFGFCWRRARSAPAPATARRRASAIAFSSPGSTIFRRLPTASGNRTCGNPAAARPAHRPRASRPRNSAARHGRSAGSPCAAG